ncbi:MAG TPA: hypothetical protein VLG11_01395 [Candidatus Saccharimonadales bacterium]|nr:hypothetical protein [Candidatus Saccharimonadales bacterium]
MTITTSDVIATISLLVSSFIAYNIYFLSKRLSFQDEMKHGAKIREQVDLLLADIRKGNSSKIEFINVKRYKKDYPHNNEESRHGYTYQGAELKGYSYDGVEFFNSAHDGYLDEKGELTIKKTDKQAGFGVLEVGVVPYEWILYIDPVGDDTAYRPQFFTHFKGRIGKHGKYRVPYRSFRYYKRNEDYDPKNQPLVMKYSSVELSNGR